MGLVGLHDIKYANWSRLNCKVKFHFIVYNILRFFMLESI